MQYLILKITPYGVWRWNLFIRYSYQFDSQLFDENSMPMPIDCSSKNLNSLRVRMPLSRCIKIFKTDYSLHFTPSNFVVTVPNIYTLKKINGFFVCAIFYWKNKVHIFNWICFLTSFNSKYFRYIFNIKKGKHTKKLSLIWYFKKRKWEFMKKKKT